MTLTRRQRMILDFIRDFTARRGYAPSLVEIGRHFGLRSPATVHKHLRNLEERGAIRRPGSRSRAIDLLPETLPLVGTLRAGRPLALDAADQTVPVPPGLIGEGKTWVLVVEGDAFHDELLRDGDLVVIEEAIPPEGAPALVLGPGNVPAIRPFRRADFPPEASAADVDPPRFLGRLLGALRKY